MPWRLAGLALTAGILGGLVAAPARAATAQPGLGAVLEQALLLESLGRSEAARRLYARAALAAREPDVRRFAVLQAARSSLAMGEPEDAMRILAEALAADPDPRFREPACREAARARGRGADLPPGLAEACPPPARSAPGPERAGPDASPEVRVLLAEQATVSLQFPLGVRLRTGAETFELPPGEAEFFLRGGKLACRVRSAGRSAAAPACGDDARIEPDGGFLRLGDHHFGGSLRVFPIGGRLAVVQHLPLETYLRGVAPGEMPAHWPPEALKAQAVAARTYALAHLRGPGRPFDLYADERSQVYLGQAHGAPATDAAVPATRGQALTHQGRPFPAYYHSHSGGRIEGAGGGLPGPAAVLAPGPEPARGLMPPMEWRVELGQEELLALLARNGHQAGRVASLRVDELSPGGRARSFSLVSDAGRVRLPAARLQQQLGTSRLRSLLCEVRPAGDGFAIVGRGYGHGVGMSQFGAAALARSGMEYTQILSRYYPGAVVARTP